MNEGAGIYLLKGKSMKYEIDNISFSWIKSLICWIWAFHLCYMFILLILRIGVLG